MLKKREIPSITDIYIAYRERKILKCVVCVWVERERERERNSVFVYERECVREKERNEEKEERLTRGDRQTSRRRERQIDRKSDRQTHKYCRLSLFISHTCYYLQSAFLFRIEGEDS